MAKRRPGMMQDDKTAPSNCPTQVIMEEYPKTGYIPGDYDDTMYGIDETIDKAVSKARKYAARKKY